MGFVACRGAIVGVWVRSRGREGGCTILDVIWVTLRTKLLDWLVGMEMALVIDVHGNSNLTSSQL